MIKKEERHWKPVLSGAGYWVCQDLWELRRGRLRGRGTGSEAGRRGSGWAHHLFGRGDKICFIKKKTAESKGSIRNTDSGCESSCWVRIAWRDG